MPEPEVAYQEFLFGDLYVCLAVPIVIKNIVITFYKMDNQIRKVVAPFTEHIKLFIFAAMEKVTDDNEFAGLKVLNLVEQALKVFTIYFLRNGNTKFAEVACFTEVQVRNDERFFFFPENAAVWREPEMLIH